MQDVAIIDLFATKGLEYLLVIGYLALLVICWGFVKPRRGRADAGKGSSLERSLFHLPEGFHFHQGHTWARSTNGADSSVMRVGLDDFALKLLGPVSGLILPDVGAHLEEGGTGWDVRVNGHVIPVLSPVDGEVVARNETLLRSAEPLNSEPYDRGWVMEVRVRNPAAADRNLLSGPLAGAWREEVVTRVMELADRPDVGWSGDTEPTEGLARTLAPDAWDHLARAFLLADEAAAGAGGQAAEREVQTV